MIHAAVLTISDSVTAGTRIDRSGPAVRDRLEQLGWRVSLMDVLPDERAQISSRLATLAHAYDRQPAEQNRTEKLKTEK